MKLHALQYLRAVAAIAVVYSHAAIQVDSYKHYLSELGAFGVDIFFVLSGFIMVYISKPTDTPLAFFKNRFRRVVPLYWFFTLLMASILLFMPSIFKNSTFDLTASLQSLLFIPHFSIAQKEMVWPILAPGWSLNYEMYFYALFALSLLLARQYRVWFVGACIFAVFALANLSGSKSAISLFYSDAIVFEFLFGMVLAIVFLKGMKVSNKAAWLMIVFGFALLIASFPIPRIIGYGIPALMIVAGTLYCRIPNVPFLVMLGDSSYALYLCHIFTLGVCRKVIPPFLGDSFASALIFAILATLICIVSGIVVHFAIDNWLLREERVTQLRQRFVSSS